MQLEIEQKKLTEALKESGQRFPDLDTQRLQVTFCLAFNVLHCLLHQKSVNETNLRIENILNTKRNCIHCGLPCWVALQMSDRTNGNYQLLIPVFLLLFFIVFTLSL